MLENVRFDARETSKDDQERRVRGDGDGGPEARRRVVSPRGASSTGLDANVAAVLAYAFGAISGVVFLIIERKSAYVRFHAMQSTLTFLAVTVLLLALVPHLAAAQRLGYPPEEFAARRERLHLAPRSGGYLSPGLSRRDRGGQGGIGNVRL